MADPNITEAESVILEALWRCGPLRPPRLIDEVRAARPWAEATVKTLLSRLMHKNAVRSEREDGVLRYRAMIERDAYLRSEVDALVVRLFGGDPAALAKMLGVRG